MRVVDVREADEFCGELGHIPGSEHVPLEAVEQAMDGWARDEVILVVCRSGRRSGYACQRLRDAGFQSVHNLDGGMLAWTRAGFPDARCDDAAATRGEAVSW